MNRPFASQVGAVTPLGEAIDGSARRKPRKAAARKPKPETASGRLCPICREAFYEFDSFARHVWDETPVYVAGLREDAENWRGMEQWGAELRERRDREIPDLLASRPNLTLPQIAQALHMYPNSVYDVRGRLNSLTEAGVIQCRLVNKDGLTAGRRSERYALADATAAAQP